MSTVEPSRRRAAAALQRSTGALSTAAMARMSSDPEWFEELSARDRSRVGLVVQGGIRAFIDWFGLDTHGDGPEGGDSPPLAAAVFGAAPRELTGVIDLRQTVDLVRLSISVVEANIDAFLDPADAFEVHRAILRYGREVAFATAEVYARAAEVRGARDARLEALVVDAVLRPRRTRRCCPRASALGWGARGDVAVVPGAVPARRTETDVFEDVRRVSQAAGMDALCATQGERLVVVLGGVSDPHKAAVRIVDHFGPGPVVVGPVTNDLGHAHASARAAMSAYRSAAGWPEAPRPVRSDELLPERALAGDGHARRHPVDEVYLPLLGARGTLIETPAAYFLHGCAIEATARHLFVHPNTVRYRLKQATDVTGPAPTSARDAFTLKIALVLGRQSGRHAPDTSL
ncbi:PucR family transcriptional regulator [Nocardioides sp. B-3]|uniref:PucR family transcriptional regulator n=1 Tax=Nocardioides sp. B-3 TaxID=2895565 RepID=UPI0021534FD0|nr:PucR family transcriptional regulator [Nocardioides sp. B-3]UUZ58608.1 helix-turn-helix domain-containing protein [Nocardioides sp. B-3]